MPGFALPLLSFITWPFEEIQRGGFAGFEIGRRAGIRGNGLVAEFFNRAGVADLRQAFFLDNRRGRFAGREHFGETPAVPLNC